MKTGQVFISHTSDMARHPGGRSFVQAVLDAVNRAGMAAVDMRYFAARENQPASYCRQRVRECEIYLAVVGFRYGSLVPGEEMSYTELEFLEASAAGKPRLVFLLDDMIDIPSGLADQDRRAVDGFRVRLRAAGLIVATFDTADRLGLEVFHSLTELAGVVARPVPRQLPAAVAHFAGRTAQLETLSALVRRPTDGGGTVVISAIGGTAGVGKTALAVYWAHQVADRFPDGQLYVNLRGFDPGGAAMQPAEAVRRFLDTLAVPAERIPGDLDAQAALYRSEVAGRRMLIVLDNARDTAQVRPLLPGTPTSLVLVTSRNQLSGLVATDGAHPINLDLLTSDEARRLLAARLGTARVAADAQAADQIIDYCARLPLALALVAAHAALHPRLPLNVLAAELTDSHKRLGVLTSDDPATDLQAVFSWSYQALTPDAQRLFRLLGLHPGPDITAPAAASLAGLPRAQVPRLLSELTRANLIVEHLPSRYAFHDLLRTYATHLARTTDGEDACNVATGRILDHYLHTAHHADKLLNPVRDPLPLAPPHPGVTPEQPTDQSQARDWFTAEHQTLLAATAHSVTTGYHHHTGQLASVLWTYLDWRGHWNDQLAAAQAAVTAARRAADPAAQVRAHRILAAAYSQLDRTDDAGTELRHALHLATQTGDQTQQAHLHRNLATLAQQRNQPAQALAHARKCLTLFQATGHTSGQAKALNAVGWCQILVGDHAQAITSCHQALTLLKQLDDPYGQAETWDTLGYAHHHLGQHAQAINCYQQSLALVRSLGDRYSEAIALTHLGHTHHATGDTPATHAAWQQALTILEDLNHPDATQVRDKLTNLETSATPAGEDNSDQGSGPGRKASP